MKNNNKLEISGQEMSVTLSTLEKVTDYLKSIRGTSLTTFIITTAVDTLKNLQKLSKEIEEKEKTNERN